MFKGACRLDDLAHRIIILICTSKVKKIFNLSYSLLALAGFLTLQIFHQTLEISQTGRRLK